MSHFEELVTNHPENWTAMQETLGDPEAIKTNIDVNELEKICTENPILKKFFESMLEHFYGYTETVWEFQEIEDKKQRGELSTEEYQEAFGGIDLTRTRSHDAMIDSVNILARAMKKFDLDPNWISPLNDPTGKAVRTRYTKLALQTTYLRIMQTMSQEGERRS